LTTTLKISSGKSRTTSAAIKLLGTTSMPVMLRLNGNTRRLCGIDLALTLRKNLYNTGNRFTVLIKECSSSLTPMMVALISSKFQRLPH
jgi:hypothetical protein